MSARSDRDVGRDADRNADRGGDRGDHGVDARGADAGETESPALPDKRYFRIGEVSRLTGVKPYVLRYWESEFRWMAPQKSRSKQRLYRKRDIEMILLIKKLLYGERYTIAGARKKLKEMGVGQALENGGLAFETSHRERYRRIRAELAQIRSQL